LAKGKGCVKDINIEKGGLMRVTTDRDHPICKGIYCQRSSAERINSQAKELGIERPKVRNRQSVRNLNTLTYIVINLRTLLKARCRLTRKFAKRGRYVSEEENGEDMCQTNKRELSPFCESDETTNV